MTRCLVNHHIIGHQVFVPVSTYMSTAEIHNELCLVYCQNVMSDGPVRQWCRMFEDGRTNVHNEERSGQLAICSK
jgi:hypothetical protein